MAQDDFDVSCCCSNISKIKPSKSQPRLVVGTLFLPLELATVYSINIQIHRTGHLCSSINNKPCNWVPFPVLRFQLSVSAQVIPDFGRPNPLPGFGLVSLESKNYGSRDSFQTSAIPIIGYAAAHRYPSGRNGDIPRSQNSILHSLSAFCSLHCCARLSLSSMEEYVRDRKAIGEADQNQKDRRQSGAVQRESSMFPSCGWQILTATSHLIGAFRTRIRRTRFDALSEFALDFARACSQLLF